MYNLWGKIAKRGPSVIWRNEKRVSPLEWVEIDEVYPNLVPDAMSEYDVYGDECLIIENPFERNINSESGLPWYRFNMKVPQSDDIICGAMNYRALIDSMIMHETDYYMLTCSCSEPGCDGFWEEYSHVSEKMVHWSVNRYDVYADLFFERESYERNAIIMLRDLIEHKTGWDNLGVPSYVDFAAFRDHIMWMLDQRPYFHAMWEETGGK